eukprot:scaffold883_cov325-Pavlova_lutheri.AAC.4
MLPWYGKYTTTTNLGIPRSYLQSPNPTSRHVDAGTTRPRSRASLNDCNLLIFSPSWDMTSHASKLVGKSDVSSLPTCHTALKCARP